MKRKFKILSLVIFSICTILLTGFTNVNAATLVREQVPNVYYARRGGGKPYGTSYVLYYVLKIVDVLFTPAKYYRTQYYSNSYLYFNYILFKNKDFQFAI